MIGIERLGEVCLFRMARSFMGRGIYYTAAYWIDGLLIDTGCAHTAEEFVNAIRSYPVNLIVNTHSHEDHIGANSLLQAENGIEIRVHELGVSSIAEPREHNSLRPYQRIMWGYPEPSMANPVGETVETTRFHFNVIHTPGHSKDHICLHEPSLGWLFCGDAYVGGRDRALRVDYNIWQILASLKKMANLNPASIFPGSGRVREGAGALLAEKTEYLERAGERVLTLSEKGWSYNRIRKEVFGKELLIAYFTLGHFSGKNLVRSFVEDR